jgi:hypothetical protein
MTVEKRKPKHPDTCPNAALPATIATWTKIISVYHGISNHAVL